MANLSPIKLIKFILLFLTRPPVAFSSIFDFVLNVLTVVYTPRVYLIDAKVNITCLHHCFVTESIDAFSFVKMSLFIKLLHYRESVMCDNLVYKIFMVNVVPMHLSTTRRF